MVPAVHTYGLHENADRVLNLPLLRGTLYCCGFACPVWALAAAFWSAATFAVLVIAGMVAWIAAGYIDYQEDR